MIQEKVGTSFECLDTGECFLNITPIAETMRLTINKWNSLKLNNLCKAMDIVLKAKRMPTEWEKIFINPTSDRGSSK